jgi:hypothetical protein
MHFSNRVDVVETLVAIIPKDTSMSLSCLVINAAKHDAILLQCSKICQDLTKVNKAYNTGSRMKDL